MSNPPDPARSLLIVEDDDRLRSRLVRALRERGYETREAGDYEGALAAARDDSPEYLLVDLRIPGGGSGLDLVREVNAIDPSTVIVVLTGYGSIATALVISLVTASPLPGQPRPLVPVDDLEAAGTLLPAGVNRAKPEIFADYVYLLSQPDGTQVLQFDNSPVGAGSSSQISAAERLLERATTVEACLGQAITWETAAQAFVQGFQSALNLELRLTPLTDQERARADALVREKYAHPSWTERV